MLIVAWKDVSFEFRVMRQHSTKKVTAIAEFGATNQGGQYKMEVQSYPKSDYMQLLVKQVFILNTRLGIFNKFLKNWTVLFTVSRKGNKPRKNCSLNAKRLDCKSANSSTTSVGRNTVSNDQIWRRVIWK